MLIWWLKELVEVKAIRHLILLLHEFHSYLSLPLMPPKSIMQQQWKATQAGKHQCKDILRNGKTGTAITILLNIKLVIRNKNSCTPFYFFSVSHVSVRWRLKSKRKMGMSSSASLDIYLNHRTGNHTSNELSSRSNTCSPPTIRLSAAPAPSGSVDKIHQMDANSSAFLNDKGEFFLSPYYI